MGAASVSRWSPPRVKVCGLTRPEDARLAVELGASYLGLNFWSGSARRVDPARGREIADAAGGRAALVGVFVDQEAAEVEAIAAKVGLDLLQFHGDEGPAAISRFAARAVKVFRLPAGGPPPGFAAELDAYPEVAAFLFDIRHQTLYGGTGVAWAWGTVAGLAAPRPVFLAGGIGPDNVRRAIREAHPDAIDVCSRVESSPGVKDPALMERLFAEVKHAQASSAP